MKRVVGSLLLLACASADEIAGANKVVEKISPELSPKSSKKFFDKDFPWDKRPKVDVLHFNHPYPVVQDSDDFDKDYIKDENSDDGSWKAQSEYDRLRHKLAQQKEDVVKAQRNTERAEKELKAAMERKADSDKQREKEAKEAAAEKAKAVKKAPVVAKPKEHKPDVVPDLAPMGRSGDVKQATVDTEKAMGALEECKKQLAKAREDLKKLMGDLDGAKKEQKEKEVTWDAARKLSKDDDDASENGKSVVKSAYQQYMDSREEFLREQAKVAKMEVDIKVAAEKVRAIRNGADDGGGVYNTHKSAAPSSMTSYMGALAITVLAYLA